MKKEIKLLKNGLTIRGDSIYCPLSFSLDSYGNCLTDCWHCYFRNLNHVWGQDLKPLDLKAFERKLTNGIKNLNPKSPLAHAIVQKKTLRFGNKTDPFQNADLVHKISGKVLFILKEMKWSTVVQTKFTDNMLEYIDTILEMKDFITILPIISPGFTSDWETFERKRTTPPYKRIEHLCYLKKQGISVGVNGEPFIPGYHTVKEFEDMLKRLKSFGLNRYNVYNFHFNAFVAKRLKSIGVDIESIWFHNQDSQWKPILQKLLNLAKKYDIILGCPDFVNTGINYIQNCNTCCGIDVSNPTTWNTHTWIRMVQEGKGLNTIIESSWDGVGDYEKGKNVLCGESSEFYTLKDAKNSGKKGLLI